MNRNLFFEDRHRFLGVNQCEQMNFDDFSASFSVQVIAVQEAKHRSAFIGRMTERGQTGLLDRTRLAPLQAVKQHPPNSNWPANA